MLSKISWRLYLIFGLPFSLLLSGCLIPYAYPHLSYVADVQDLDPPEDVRAFRIDVSGSIVDVGENDEFTLTPLTLSKKGRVPSQTDLTLDYGLYVVGVALNYPMHHGHSTLVRLYRPGYKLVELRAWEKPPMVRFEQATSFQDQENTIDNLLSPPSIEAPQAEFGYGRYENSSFCRGQVKPGSTSRKHREALLFAVSEYERLASSTASDQNVGKEVSARLLRKAQELRDQAAK
jgi:hypothetical protein